MIIFPPKEGYDKIKAEDFVVFLAGPIQGAEDWQSEACGTLWDSFHDDYDPNPLFGDRRLWIANPRAKDWHRDYEGQVKWETAHLHSACWGGVIMFWCAKQQTHFCDRPHGQTTRFELGEWIGRKDVLWASEEYNVRLVVGIEPGFSNESYIRSRLGALWPEMKIPSTLHETCGLVMEELSSLAQEKNG